MGKLEDIRKLENIQLFYAVEKSMSNHIYGLRKAITDAEDELKIIKMKCEAIDNLLNK